METQASRRADSIAPAESMNGTRAGDKPRMTLEERSDLVLAFARVLFTNGQSTDQTMIAAERVGETLGLKTGVIARWGEVRVEAEDGDARATSIVEADPTNVAMERVAAATRAVEDLAAGRLPPSKANEIASAISRMPPAPTWLFTLAAAFGASALAVIFGVQHESAAVLVFASAGCGAILRRMIARYSANIFVQPFAAALVAGFIGGVAVRFELSSTLRLVAVCPCMVLVPGPHVLNGALDLAKGRIHLGSARLVYATLVTLAISTGLLLGLGMLGVSLPIDEAGRLVPLWFDAIAAGVAVAAYAVFFSMPANMFPWPIAVGMLAHAVRWWLLDRGASPATAAFVACVVVGSILTPVARHWRMPFAAIGFAAVVSMIPGVFLFRMASGLVRIANGSHADLNLLDATLADAMTAFTIVVAMSIGLIVSKLIIDRLLEGQQNRTEGTASN